MRTRHILHFGLLMATILSTRLTNGQCLNDNVLSGVAITVACPGSISGGCIQGGQYALVNVTIGNIYTFSTCDASWNTFITLYNNAGGVNVGFNDDACNGTRSALQWTATFTGQLRVLVDRNTCATNGTCAPLWITCALNNDPCSATALTVYSAGNCTSTTGTNVGATATGGVANPSCGTYSGGDVWYSFVAPSSGNVTITTTTAGGSSLTDGAMAVYSATSCSAGITQIACNDNSAMGGNMPQIPLTGLTSGATYYVRFWENGNNVFGAFNICIEGPPANDDPCAATALAVGTSCTNTIGSNVTVSNTTGITAPSCGAYTGGDVWFTFVAPASGQVTVTTSTVSGSALTDGVITVYTATACAGTYTEVNCMDDTPSGGLMPVMSLSGLTSGTTYYVRFWEYGNNRFGTFNICVTRPASLANDDPCTATSLTVAGTCTNTTSTTAGSTNTAGVSAPTCGNYSGNDAWFSAVAPASGALTVTTSTVTGSSLTNAALAIYSAPACGGTMTEIGCNANSPSNNMPELTLTGLTSGTTYYIRVWAEGNTTFGQFNICATEPPAHDEPCGAITLTVGTSCSNTSSTNVSATTSAGMSIPGCGNFTTSSRDVWFNFTAPASGIAIIQSTAGTLTDGSMALYKSNTCTASGLTLVQCSSDEGAGAMPFLRFANLVPGDTYYIRYWGIGSSSGTFNLCVWAPTLPGGFNCHYFLEMFDSGENGWGTSSVDLQIDANPVTSYTVPAGQFYNIAIIGLTTGTLTVSYVNTGGGQAQNRYALRQVVGGYGVFMDGPSPTAGIVLIEDIDCTPPDPPNEDCVGSTGICDGQSFNDNPSGTGFDVDLRVSTFGCLSAAERQGTWYKFSPSSGGTVALTIAPSDPEDDYDFAIWGPDNSITCPPSRQPTRCSWSDDEGDTGLRAAATDTTEDSSGDKWVAPLTVTAGNYYLLYISNYSQSGLAFSLSWTLTDGASLDCSLLPVDFIDLQAELVGEAVEVRWSTASERNASHYIVERSSDAFEYLPIGTLQAMGNTTTTTSYAFLDESPKEGLNYYRVQQVDLGGGSMISPADHAIYRKASTEMVVFPNPAGDILFASFEMPEDDAVIWRVMDSRGRLVEQDLYQGTKGNMLIDVPLERLAPGNYTLLVNDAKGLMNRSAHFVKH